MRIEYAGLTDVGRKRDHNEDNYTTEEDLGLYIVCDGMGGHAAGEVASEMSVNAVRDVLRANRSVLEAFQKEDTPAGRASIIELVESAIAAGCAAVYEASQADPNKKGMGTTLIMVLVANDIGFMGHVGDSRLYVQREGEAHQLSEDHSFVREMVRLGKMTEEEAHNSPVSNVITRAVGIEESVQADTLAFDILPGDTFVLCSDGLSDYLANEAQLSSLLGGEGSGEQSLEEVAKKLVDYANESGGKDNVTTVLIRGLGEETHQETETVRARDVHLKLSVLKRVRLFKHLSYKELVVLLNLTEVEIYEEGTTVIEEGSDDNDFYVVLHGRAEVTRNGHQLTVLEAGDHFGEMELISKRERSASVTTLTKAGVLAIRRADFMNLLKASEHLAVKLLWSFLQTLSARLDDTNQQVSD